MSISDLRPTNKRSIGKEEDLVKTSSKRLTKSVSLCKPCQMINLSIMV